MNGDSIYLLAIGIGTVAGLRAMTAPAAVSWAAYLGCINLQGSPLAFMGSVIAVGIFSLGLIGEDINDKLPKTPSRTAPGPLSARVAMGALSGACLGAAAHQSLLIGGVLGAIGAVIGSFGGYQVRTRLVSGLKVKDILIALPEDLIAIALGYWLVCRR